MLLQIANPRPFREFFPIHLKGIQYLVAVEYLPKGFLSLCLFRNWVATGQMLILVLSLTVIVPSSGVYLKALEIRLLQLSC